MNKEHVHAWLAVLSAWEGIQEFKKARIVQLLVFLCCGAMGRVVGTDREVFCFMPHKVCCEKAKLMFLKQL